MADNWASTGLDERALSAIQRMTEAVLATDANSYYGIARTLKSNGEVVVVYQSIIIKRALILRNASRMPSGSQIHQFAQSCELRLQVMGHFEVSAAELAIRDLFAEDPIVGAPRGPAFLLYAGILVGALVADGSVVLNEMTPWIAHDCAALAKADPQRWGYLRPVTPHES